MDCGECSLCCDIPPIKELEKPSWELCSNYDTDCKNCKIYKERPEECRNFECSYWQSPKANISVRPDNCGVMFEMISDNIFLGSLHPERELSEVANGQIDSFVKQGYSVVLSRKDEKLTFYISDKHDNTEIFNEFKQIVKEQNYGSTSLRN